MIAAADKLTRGPLGLLATEELCSFNCKADESAGINVTRYYELDHLGTIRAISDHLGHLVSTSDYEPFGLELKSADAAFPWWSDTSSNTHKFTGHERDEEAGEDYMKARMYVLSTARFPQIDPQFGGAGDPQNWNPYIYVMNSPVGASDPTGMAEKNIAMEERSGASSSQSSSSDESDEKADPYGDVFTLNFSFGLGLGASAQAGPYKAEADISADIGATAGTKEGASTDFTFNAGLDASAPVGGVGAGVNVKSPVTDTAGNSAIGNSIKTTLTSGAQTKIITYQSGTLSASSGHVEQKGVDLKPGAPTQTDKQKSEIKSERPATELKKEENKPTTSVTQKKGEITAGASVALLVKVGVKATLNYNAVGQKFQDSLNNTWQCAQRLAHGVGC